MHGYPVFTEGKSNMKTITNTSIYLPTAAMLLTMALAGPLAAEQQVTFRGSLQGQEIDIPQPPGTFGRWDRHGNCDPPRQRRT